MALHFVLSEKKKRKLIDSGHLFVKENEKEERVIWKCDKYYKTRCPARIHSKEDSITRRIGEHNHAGNISRFELTPQVPPNPENLLQLKIPFEYTITHSNQDFLLFDSDDGTERMIIFATRKNLQLLASAKQWYADGTFKTVPPLFQQLYTIHGVVHGVVLPLVYALMASRTEDRYTRLFAELKSLEPTLSPDTILTDFERAAINAFKENFPNSSQKGCFFHFSQSIFRSIQSNGLQQQYENSTEFALKMRMLAAIAYVPVSEVVTTFESLCDSDEYPEESQPVLDYVEDIWIGRPDRRLGRRPPRFAHDLWNYFTVAKEGATKTNNSCESWHRSFTELIGTSHPTIWKFLNILKKEQAKNEVIIEQYISGLQEPHCKKKYKDSALRIQRLVNDYENRELFDYLRGIAHNLSM